MVSEPPVKGTCDSTSEYSSPVWAMGRRAGHRRFMAISHFLSAVCQEQAGFRRKHPVFPRQMEDWLCQYWAAISRQKRKGLRQLFLLIESMDYTEVHDLLLFDKGALGVNQNNADLAQCSPGKLLVCVLGKALRTPVSALLHAWQFGFLFVSSIVSSSASKSQNLCFWSILVFYKGVGIHSFLKVGTNSTYLLYTTISLHSITQCQHWSRNTFAHTGESWQPKPEPGASASSSGLSHLHLADTPRQHAWAQLQWPPTSM